MRTSDFVAFHLKLWKGKLSFLIWRKPCEAKGNIHLKMRGCQEGKISLSSQCKAVTRCPGAMPTHELGIPAHVSWHLPKAAALGGRGWTGFLEDGFFETAESQISALPSIRQVIPLLIKPTRGELNHTILGNFQDKQMEKRKRKEYRTISFSLLSVLRNHSGWISYHEAYSFTIYQVQT